MDRTSEPAYLRAWSPGVAGIREVLHARFTEHAYPPHTHDTWTLFIVDEGGVRYDLDGRAKIADLPMVSILPPHVVHDGRPGRAGGYRKRVLYVESTVLPDALIGAAVDHPAIADMALRGDVADLHETLVSGDDKLEAETRFLGVLGAVRRSLGERPETVGTAPDATLADALRSYLDAHAFEAVTLAAAASELGWSEAHLARAFTRLFGIAPHTYLLGRRLDAARARILAGEALAETATSVGFADQAHLTRRFKKFLGTTPGAFARAGGDRRRGVV